MKPLDIHDEWLSLIEVSGPFLATPVLKRVFSTGLPAVEPRIRQYLRQAYDEWCEARDNNDPRLAELHRAWIHEVLARGLEYDESDSGEHFLGGEHIPAELRVTLPEHGVILAPDYALVSGSKNQLLVQIYPAGTELQTALKIDGWITNPAERMERLCRASGCRLGLVTDGERWMLVDAPVGAVSTFASWYARLWGQERLTLQAFLTLLGIRRFFGPDDESLSSMLDESLQHQEEVTDALGEQVRRAVEVLIQALDKEDRERSRTLLQGVEPTELYEAGLTIMMRLVFLLSAEERGLLLMGEEAYESNYAISTLRMQLRQETEEVLERRNDAWSRLLATFRAVYGGIEHETLRLPALGGSLFDPDRFPFLEGRAQGSDWKIDPARPLPIDNRTVLLLLEAIQQYEGRTLSYRALDVEQVGYVYEGLLERTVRRTERVTVELAGGKGAKKTLYGLDELEALRCQGTEALVDALSGIDAIKRGTGPIRKDLERSVGAALANRLLTACAGDEELRDRTLPFLNLLRTDPWGYPLIYPEGAFIVTTGSDRRETGTHYTPKSLTESIVEATLESVTYIGPAEGLPREQWSLKSAAELLDLKICDPAMGSGAFLVQVCRWLAERIVEAWAAQETTGRCITSEGVAVNALADLEGLPANPEDRLVIARRLVAERCLYGVDLNPLAVELAKLSIWLVTLAKGRPFGFLDHNLKCGDSLLGIHRLDQLTELSMKPGAKGQQRLFGKNIELAVHNAIELRQRLREMPIRDIHDVEAMARLEANARSRLKAPERIADAFIGEVIAAGDSDSALASALTSLAIHAGQTFSSSQGVATEIDVRMKSTLSIDLPAGKLARRPFHWPLEFPEVFFIEKSGFDCILGNPPFLGGQKITGVFGTAYRTYLVANLADGKRGSADLVAYFFLRAFQLLSPKGGFGLLAVNTISQGDTREVGLDQLVAEGGVIRSATTDEKWPGSAAVVTTRVGVIKGEWGGLKCLNNEMVSSISAHLTARQLLTPKRLSENSEMAFMGSIPLGDGFLVTPGRADELIKQNPKNAEILKPYLSATDVLRTPDCVASRWVIDFGGRSLESAREYGEVFEIVERFVRPVREANKRKSRREQWWRFAERAPALYNKIKSNDMVMFHAFTTKYVAFSMVPAHQSFAGPNVIIASSSFSLFSCLHSSLFDMWAWTWCSTMKRDLRFAPTDSIETFPFPDFEENSLLHDLGVEYESLRRKVMLANNIGLTSLYNMFHDQCCELKEVVVLREIRARIDHAVVELYGWSDTDLNHGFHEMPYLPENDRTRYTISEFARSEALQRLVELNFQRCEEGGAVERGRSKVVPRIQERSAHIAAAPQQVLDL